MLVGLLLMMHESPFPLQAMLRSEFACALDPRDHSRQHCLQGEGGSIGSAVLGAVTKLRHRRMLATLEGKQLRTSSWASYRVCEVCSSVDWQPQQSAASRFVGSEQGLKR